MKIPSLFIVSSSVLSDDIKFGRSLLIGVTKLWKIPLSNLDIHLGFFLNWAFKVTWIAEECTRKILLLQQKSPFSDHSIFLTMKLLSSFVISKFRWLFFPFDFIITPFHLYPSVYHAIHYFNICSFKSEPFSSKDANDFEWFSTL